MALLDVDARQAEPLTQHLLRAEPSEVAVLRQSLRPHARQVAPRLWDALESQSEDRSVLLSAASALAVFSPDSTRWQPVARRVAAALTQVETMEAATWAELLMPARQQLIESLAEIHRNDRSGHSLKQRLQATDILCLYAADQLGWLCELIRDSEPDQLTRLIPRLRHWGPSAIEMLAGDLDREPVYDWRDAALDEHWSDVSARDRSVFAAGQGMVRERFAFCQQVALEPFRELVDSLRASGYRPLRRAPVLVPG